MNRCGINHFGFLYMNAGRPHDPLYHDHALIARGRAGIRASTGVPIDILSARRRLEAAGCDVPDEQPGGEVAVLRARRVATETPEERRERRNARRRAQRMGMV